MSVSETKVYAKIASHFDNYSAAAVYQHAKRYFKPNQTPKYKYKSNSESIDFLQSYDRYKLKPEQLTKFTVSIAGVPLFRDESGKVKPTNEWSLTSQKIVFAMSQSPCAWSIQRPRMVGNEITLNGYCKQDECDAKCFAHTQNNHSTLVIHVTPANGKIKHDKKKSDAWPAARTDFANAEMR